MIGRRLGQGAEKGKGCGSGRMDNSPECGDDGRMQHSDHVALIRAGVEGAGPNWLELGAGDGEFTLALADLLGYAGEITAVDRDRRALAALESRLVSRFPSVSLETRTLDFTRELPPGRAGTRTEGQADRIARSARGSVWAGRPTGR